MQIRSGSLLLLASICLPLPSEMNAADLTAFEWTPNFFIHNGCSGDIHDIEILSETELILVGNFQECAGISANRAVLVDWAAREWKPLGSGTQNGLNGTVYTSAIHDGHVYVGGAFTSAASGSGTISTNRIARWDPAQGEWEALGTPDANGLNGTVHVIESHLQALYIGGSFTSILANAGSSARGIATLVDNVLSPLGSMPGNGVDGAIFSIAPSDQSIHIGGFFSSSTDFTNTTLNNVGKWSIDTNSWEPLASGDGVGVSGPVHAVEKHGTRIYVGGEFDQINDGIGTVANGIASWDGTAWQTIDSYIFPGNAGVSGSVYELRTTENGLLVAGDYAVFSPSNPDTLRNLGFLAADQWQKVGSDERIYPAGAVFATAWTADSQLFVGGAFPRISSTLGPGQGPGVNGIAGWKASEGWFPIGRGDGIDGSISDIAQHNDKLYVGGEFYIAGDKAVNNIAAWNGTAWEKLGAEDSNGVLGISTVPEVRDLHVHDGRLIVAGNFREAADGSTIMTANNIASWNADQKNWSPIEGIGGNGLSGGVNAVASSQTGLLYFGGEFLQANVGNEISANRIVAYDGFQFLPLMYDTRNGVSGTVFSIESIGENVYIGGHFDTAGDGVSGTALNVNNIVGWDGAGWVLLGPDFNNGLDGPVYALEAFNGNLIAGGLFQTALISSLRLDMNNIAAWSGITWAPLGSAGGNGTSFAVLDLFNFDDSRLIVGGNFDEVNVGNGISTTNVAEWDGTSWSGWPSVNQPSVEAVWAGNNKRFIGTHSPIPLLGVSTLAELGLPEYTVTPIAVGDGLIVPGEPQTVFKGSQLTFSLEPGGGNEVHDISGDCGGSASSDTYVIENVDSDCEFSVLFDVIGLIFRDDFEGD